MIRVMSSDFEDPVYFEKDDPDDVELLDVVIDGICEAVDSGDTSGKVVDPNTGEEYFWEIEE